MNNTKLLQALAALSAWELKSFETFLASPFFNRREDVQAMLRYVFDERKKPMPRYDKGEAFAAAYPGKPYQDQHIRLLMSRLFKLLETFLALRKTLEDEAFMNKKLAAAYRELALDQHFLQAIRQSANALESDPNRSSRHLRQRYELELEHYDFIGSRIRSKETNAEQVAAAFDVFSIAEKLRQGCSLLSHQMVYKKEYYKGMLDPVLAYVESHREPLPLEGSPTLLDFPAIAIYYHCYLALTSGEEHHFQQLRQLLRQHRGAFSNSEIGGIYLLAINFCIKRLNTGGQKFIREGFELYRAGLEEGVLEEGGHVSPFTFGNTVALGLSLKQFEWVEQFLEAFKLKLHPEHRQQIFNFNLARLRYEQGNYPQARRLLAQFDPQDYLLDLAAKTILLKIYYETDEFDALDALLHSMSAYLHRKDVLGYHKTHFENFIRFARRLIELPPGNPAARLALRQDIEAAGMQSEREWFFRQLA